MSANRRKIILALTNVRSGGSRGGRKSTDRLIGNLMPSAAYAANEGRNHRAWTSSPRPERVTAQRIETGGISRTIETVTRATSGNPYMSDRVTGRHLQRKHPPPAHLGKKGAAIWNNMLEGIAPARYGPLALAEI